MMQIGDMDYWVGFVDSRIPDILETIIATWELMPPPAGNALEDTISKYLCNQLRQSRQLRELPFSIHSQVAELDPSPGEEEGRMDIVFFPRASREDIYFCLECKRLNVLSHSGKKPRSYASEYVKDGMFRFVRGQYAKSVHCGGMLAYVLDGNLDTAIDGVAKNIKRNATELGMQAKATLESSAIRPEDFRCKETLHDRIGQHNKFVIHHLFMPGDPNTPLNADKPARSKKIKK